MIIEVKVHDHLRERESSSLELTHLRSPYTGCAFGKCVRVTWHSSGVEQLEGIGIDFVVLHHDGVPGSRSCGLALD